MPMITHVRSSKCYIGHKEPVFVSSAVPSNLCMGTELGTTGSRVYFEQPYMIIMATAADRLTCLQCIVAVGDCAG